MAEPSRTRNFFGRVVDRILPGTNYDRTTGQYSNVGKGIAGLGARLAATAFAGPAVGALVGKGASYLIDHTGNQVGGVQPEGINPYGPVTPGYAGAVTLPATPNLGLGAQAPGNSWTGYLQGQGAVNNFGNTQFGNGMAGIPNSWTPQSTWGQSVAEGQGSNLNFGNNSPGALPTGAVRGNGGAAAGVNSGSRGGGGGNSVGDAGGARSAFWRKTHQIN